jgi:dienelactone hydrolase
MSCPDCFKGSVHTHAGEAKGNLETVYGKNCYVASPSSTSTSTSVIIYLTDAFGLNLINTKLLADRFAAETGCKVLVPDVIPGGGGPVSLMGYTEILQTRVPLGGVFGQLRRISAAFAVAYYSVPFYLRILTWAAPQRAFSKNILPFARAVRADLPPGAKLGIVGFCWGGYGSTRICAEPAVKGGSERLVDVQFCGHPYNLKTPDIVVDAVRGFKVPFSMAIGDLDKFLSKGNVDKIEVALKEKVGSGKGDDDYNYEVKVYKACKHGFVVRANPSNEVETAAAEDARAQAVAWLNKYL